MTEHEHSFPIQPPNGSFFKPGDCACGMTFDVAEQIEQQEDAEMPRTLLADLTQVLNRHSAENASGTPDFVLAAFLARCLGAYNIAAQTKDAMTNRSPQTAAEGAGVTP